MGSLLQISDVPDEGRRGLKARAAGRGQSLNAYLLDIIERETEAFTQGTAKAETVCWYDRTQPWRISQLRPCCGRRIWNTQLGETEFSNCWDRTSY